MPAATASSTIYCITGRSTMGSISFGTVLVTGSIRVPSPAAGITAFLTFIQENLAFLLLCPARCAGAEGHSLSAGSRLRKKESRGITTSSTPPNT